MATTIIEMKKGLDKTEQHMARSLLEVFKDLNGGVYAAKNKIKIPKGISKIAETAIKLPKGASDEEKKRLVLENMAGIGLVELKEIEEN